MPKRNSPLPEARGEDGRTVYSEEGRETADRTGEHVEERESPATEREDEARPTFEPSREGAHTRGECKERKHSR